jgi:uncharacterized protein YrrD
MSDPVSWLLIERGWKVFGANGNEVGTVHEVTGDSGQDIFDGLSISSGTFDKPRYLPAERITRIEEGAVYVDVADLSELTEYQKPAPSEKILAEPTSWWERFKSRF